MIRFIYIGEQITGGSEDFAFYDTVADQFLSFQGEHVFDGRKEFELYAKNDERFQRCFDLIPENIR